jgi:hypothetical protein
MNLTAEAADALCDHAIGNREDDDLEAALGPSTNVAHVPPQFTHGVTMADHVRAMAGFHRDRIAHFKQALVTAGGIADPQTRALWVEAARNNLADHERELGDRLAELAALTAPAQLAAE